MLPGGEVAQSLRYRITEDGKKIGHVAENLLSVQSDINRVEKEVLGKVFDVQTVRNFFTQHQQVVDENSKLRKDTADLNGEIESLSSQLAKAQKDAVAADKDFRAQEAGQRAKLGEDAAVIEGLQKELVHVKTLERDNEKLKEINRAIREQNTKTVDQAQLVHKELNEAKITLHDHMQSSQRLQDQLVDQHKYGNACHEKVKELEKKLGVETARLTKESANNAAAAEAANTAGLAAQRRLVDENAAMRAQIANAGNMIKALQLQVAGTESTIANLQTQSATELGHMKEEMGKMRQHVLVVRDSLMQNIRARKMVQDRLSDTMKQIEYLEGQLRSAGFAQLEIENKNLKEDLKNTAKALQMSQVEEAQAKGEMAQATAQEAALKNAAKLNADAAQHAAEAAAGQVAKAHQIAVDAKEKASEDAMNAEATVAGKCGDIWRDEHKKLISELKQCKQTRADLTSAQAQVKSMKSSLESSSV